MHSAFVFSSKAKSAYFPQHSFLLHETVQFDPRAERSVEEAVRCVEHKQDFINVPGHWCEPVDSNFQTHLSLLVREFLGTVAFKESSDAAFHEQHIFVVQIFHFRPGAAQAFVFAVRAVEKTKSGEAKTLAHVRRLSDEAMEPLPNSTAGRAFVYALEDGAKCRLFGVQLSPPERDEKGKPLPPRVLRIV